MQARQPWGAVAIAAVLALCGCAVTPPPAGPTRQDVSYYNERLLELTWANTGIAGERPEVEQGEPLTQGDWFDFVFSCFASRGIADVALGWSLTGGATISTPSGAVIDDERVQRHFFECAAAHPMDVAQHNTLLSVDQLEYVYNYYADELVPCILLHGYTLGRAVTRQDFVDSLGQWNPYYSIAEGMNLLEYDELRADCGPEQPPLS